MNKRILGVIPARFGSTRFPGKPLHPILGKPLLQWVIEGVRTSKTLTKLIVATDDQRILELAKRCGVEAQMTNSDLPTGSDRVWAVAQEEDCDVVVNIQGDEPLINGTVIDQLVAPFESRSDLEMSTLGRTLTEEDLMSPQTAKIVLSENGEALYFSRLPIPYTRQAFSPVRHEEGGHFVLKHLGVYAYSKEFLKRYCERGPVLLEMAESLEQLRALYMGARIQVIHVNHESWGVDTPEDVLKVEDRLKHK